MKEKFPLNKVVVVYWKDAASTDNWDSLENYLEHTPIDAITAGFLLASNKDYVTIATTQSSHGQLNQAMSIPRTWIHKVVEIPELLKESSKPKGLAKKKSTPKNKA